MATAIAPSILGGGGAPGRCYFFSAFSRALAFCTAAIFSGRFMRFHLRISSFDRPQLTQRSPFS